MARIVLVIGGSRSGKSDYAQALAETMAGPRYYLATCPPCSAEQDPEMAARILAHRQSRAGRAWQAVEEGVEVTQALKRLPTEATVLVDCLTLWISNLLWADQAGSLDEPAVSRLARELLAAAGERRGPLLMVSSEVGSGLVPEHTLSRRFRDLVGRCNQVMAAGSDQVVQVVCGIPLTIKG